MRLMVKLGYQDVLFAKGANYSALIESLATARVVSVKYEAGQTLYVDDPNSTGPMEFKLIEDDSIILPDIQRPEAVDYVLNVSKERDDLRVENYRLKAQIEKDAKEKAAA